MDTCCYIECISRQQKAVGVDFKASRSGLAFLWRFSYTVAENNSGNRAQPCLATDVTSNQPVTPFDVRTAPILVKLHCL